MLIEATRLLDDLDLVAVFVGSDRDREAYRRELETRAQGLPVRFAGHTDDVAAAYAASDVAVSAPVHPESFGRVLAEDGTMGLPVVASDHGGTSEIVLHDETGWLVPPAIPQRSPTVSAAPWPPQAPVLSSEPGPMCSPALLWRICARGRWRSMGKCCDRFPTGSDGSRRPADSLLSPHLNEERRIGAAIEAALPVACEVVVLDSGSTDGMVAAAGDRRF